MCQQSGIHTTITAIRHFFCAQIISCVISYTACATPTTAAGRHTSSVPCSLFLCSLFLVLLFFILVYSPFFFNSACTKSSLAMYKLLPCVPSTISFSLSWIAMSCTGMALGNPLVNGIKWSSAINTGIHARHLFPHRGCCLILDPRRITFTGSAGRSSAQPGPGLSEIITAVNVCGKMIVA